MFPGKCHLCHIPSCFVNWNHTNWLPLNISFIIMEDISCNIQQMPTKWSNWIYNIKTQKIGYYFKLFRLNYSILLFVHSMHVFLFFIFDKLATTDVKKLLTKILYNVTKAIWLNVQQCGNMSWKHLLKCCVIIFDTVAS